MASRRATHAGSWYSDSRKWFIQLLLLKWLLNLKKRNKEHYEIIFFNLNSGSLPMSVQPQKDNHSDFDGSIVFSLIEICLIKIGLIYHILRLFIY